MTESLQLGSRHELKLQRHKPFSRKTFANNLLLDYIGRIKARAIELKSLRIEYPFEIDGVEQLPEEKLTFETPLTKATAKAWMEAIWKLILADFPAPESDNRLKQLGADKGRKTRISLRKSSPKSEATNLRAGIRDELLKYLYRLLPDK